MAVKGKLPLDLTSETTKSDVLFPVLETSSLTEEELETAKDEGRKQSLVSKQLKFISKKGKPLLHKPKRKETKTKGSVKKGKQGKVRNRSRNARTCQTHLKF